MWHNYTHSLKNSTLTSLAQKTERAPQCQSLHYSIYGYITPTKLKQLKGISSTHRGFIGHVYHQHTRGTTTTGKGKRAPCILHKKTKKQDPPKPKPHTHLPQLSPSPTILLSTYIKLYRCLLIC